jgi:CubicO group peptidase (beta-lactamase class C family)
MPDLTQQLKDFINESLALWKVPGVGVGVVRGEEVLLCQGFGLRDREGGQPVTPNSLFAIGSCSKAFTTFDLGLLVDEGKLDWDRPLRDFLPTFQLNDPFASQHITARDIVSHRVGLPRHDLLWYNSPLNRQQIFERLRYLELNKDIRQTFQYNNLMFMTAGVLIQHLSGLSWEDFTRQRVFEPLGMQHSNFSITASQQTDDFALPYQEKKDQVERMPFRNVDAIGPAGSMNSCAADLLKWMQVHLNQGKLGERAVISSANLEQMHSPQMIIQGTPKWKEELPGSYGLGWFVRPYRGRQIVEHGGNIDGFSALVAMLPDEKIGVAVLANLNGTSLPTSVAYRVFDLLLGLEPVDWNERFHKDHLEIKAAIEQSEKHTAAERKEGHPPAHALEEYIGEYQHPGYGTISLSLQDGKMQALLNDIVFRVEPYHYEIFEFHYDLIEMHVKGSFTTDEKGNVSKLALPLEPNVKEIVFERAAENQLRERAFLDRLVGTYEIMGMPLAITLKGEDTLAGTLPGQPSLELVPYRGTTFNVKGLAGASLTFHMGESGPADSLELVQPGAVLQARRIQ